MINFRLKIYTRKLPQKITSTLIVTAFCLAGGQVLATEPGTLKPHGGGGGFSAENQQWQNQNQSQFQEQNQTQTQGHNRVDVDGDDNDYLALAIPNLVAANCAGQSYSLGAGGAGFGFGLGQAKIDENCQIAKAIATAHLLQRTGLVSLNKIEYREALCQMRGMEHVCKGVKPPVEPPVACKSGKWVHKNYKPWCAERIAMKGRVSQWRDQDLKSCGLKRTTFDEDIKSWSPEPYCRPVGLPPKTTDVEVRTGKHCGYDRVVFEWPERVKYGFERQGDKVIIKFHGTKKVDVSRVSRTLGRYILSAYSEELDYRTVVTLKVSDNIKHRIWAWERRVIFDARTPSCDLEYRQYSSR